MKPSHRTIVWVFESLGLDLALAGDLIEESACGRSPIWFWRQVLLGIWVGVWSMVFDHKMLALRAILTGCAVNGIWLFLWTQFLRIGLPAHPVISLEAVMTLSVILLTQIATGWIVARTHRPYAIPMVCAFALWLVLWFLGSSVPEAARLVTDAIDQPRFRSYLVWLFTPILIEVAGLLVGGMAGARPMRPPSSQFGNVRR
jgi:hypothetical protein